MTLQPSTVVATGILDIEASLSVTLLPATLRAFGTPLKLMVGGLVNRTFRKHGEVMQLSRESEDITIILRGRRLGGDAVDSINGTAAQYRFEVKVATDEIAASPWIQQEVLRNDGMVIGGRFCNVISARPQVEKGIIEAFIIEVVG